MTSPDDDVARLSASLRSMPSLIGTAPPWDLDPAPPDPMLVFAHWLRTAVDAGVPEPHAMTLSTVGEDGIPDARVLILKALGADAAWGLASTTDSAKGRQLIAAPVAAASFYWPSLNRSVRIRGTVEPATTADSNKDFARRDLGARAVALAGASGTPLADPAEQSTAVGAWTDRLERGERPPHTWLLWWIRALHVEFWQARADRQHLRRRYSRTSDGWSSVRLWS